MPYTFPAPVRATSGRAAGAAGRLERARARPPRPSPTAPPSSPPRASVRAWLCGIGYNQHLTARRSAARDRAREALFESEREQTRDAASEDKLALDRALAGLPAEQRACVALCLAADFSHAEASEALGSPLGTVKSHISRGRARLLQALGVCDDAS